MDKFKHSPRECACVDKETNRRIFWLNPEIPGRVYTRLHSGDVADAAGQFQRYGVLPQGEFQGDDRISTVTFECDLTVMVEQMLERGFDDPVRQMSTWLLALQRCSKRVGEELLKVQSEEGPSPSF
jgi:hypothetical protein